MDLNTLYPFLESVSPDDAADSRAADLATVHAAVVQSTVDKAGEIVALREEVHARFGDRLVDCARTMASALRAGGRLFTFGNGGSSTDAGSLAQLFLSPGPGGRPLPAMSLTTDIALLTALTNDVGFAVVFARQLAALGGPGDIALGLSTSGGSTNVLAGLESAHRRGMVTVGLAGSGGGAMAESEAIDHLFVVPSPSVHRIQEAQTTIYHILWELIQHALSHDELAHEPTQPEPTHDGLTHDGLDQPGLERCEPTGASAGTSQAG